MKMLGSLVNTIKSFFKPKPSKEECLDTFNKGNMISEIVTVEDIDICSITLYNRDEKYVVSLTDCDVKQVDSDVVINAADYLHGCVDLVLYKTGSINIHLGSESFAYFGRESQWMFRIDQLYDGFDLLIKHYISAMIENIDLYIKEEDKREKVLNKLKKLLNGELTTYYVYYPYNGVTETKDLEIYGEENETVNDEVIKLVFTLRLK